MTRADAREGDRSIPASRAWLVDAVLAAGVAGIVALVISANQGGRQEPDALAYLWAVGLGALMLVRRRWPRLVLGATVLGLFAYYAAGYPAVGVAVPVAAAVFSAAEMGRLITAVCGALAVVIVSVGFRLLEGQQFTTVVSYELAGHVLLLAAAVALGDSVRSRRALAVSARRLVESTAAEERERARSAAHATRVAIARDLHDNVGHAVTVISLHADVANEAIGRDDDAARGALGVVKHTSQSVMSELRGTVRRLRERDTGTDGHRSLTDIDSLVRGLPIEVDSHIDTTIAVNSDVGDAAYRIVQEALTNVVRHSGATQASVTVVAGAETLEVRVVDNGIGASGTERHGLGILGMRERATEVGGTLETGTSDAVAETDARREQTQAAGFVVQATLPQRGRR